MKNFSTIATQYIYVLLFLHCCCCTMFVLVLVQAADPSSSEAPMHKAEQQALYSAVQAFVGSWWNGSDLYPDPCGWTPIQGVYCDLYNDFWYVSVINIGPLYDNSLRCTTNIAEFSHHLFNLKHLKVLSFFSCFLSPSQNPITISTSNWEKLANSLESLEFRSNPGLIGTVPNTFGYLRNLQSLVLLENGLGGNLPEEIGTLVNLRRLVLAGNQFSGKIPESFGGLSKLLILDASRNKLSGSLPLTFGSLTSLLKLDLSNNMLEGKLPREIGRLKNLTLLDLGSNKISGGLTQSLEELVSVKEMVISNNPIGGGLKSIEWQNLQSLEILDLSNTCLTGNIHKSMAEMKRLRFLGLNSNNLSGRVSPRLAALPCIGALYLYGNNFTGELEFSESFYRRMGRRFGAWNNPKLCYRAEVNSTGHVPYGVKSCKQETTINISGNVPSNAKFSEANWDHSIQFVASLGFSSCNLDGAAAQHRKFMILSYFYHTVRNIFLTVLSSSQLVSLNSLILSCPLKNSCTKSKIGLAQRLPSTSPPPPLFTPNNPHFQVLFVTCTKFEVGGKNGWEVPKSKNDQQMYNQWASDNRFKVDDTLHFNYTKDSVLVVTKDEYEKCHSAHPIFFSNNGVTVFTLDRPGLFYFISGVSGHCERGQKMIIKVLEPASPPQSADQNEQKNDAAVAMATISSATLISCIMSFVGVLFF
ncbi:unnamed protein product [Prunus armeniaca]